MEKIYTKTVKPTLKDIAQLQPGVYLKTNENASDKAFLLGIKDFDDELNLMELSATVDKKDVRDKYIIKEAHILFSARMLFKAFKIPETKEVLVASNSFILIKPDVTKVCPDYLRWFLNHPHTDHQLKQLTQGTSRVPYISQKKLGNLSITLPELSVQKNIAAVYNLMDREKSIRQKLNSKREEYLQQLLLNIIKE